MSEETVRQGLQAQHGPGGEEQAADGADRRICYRIVLILVTMKGRLPAAPPYGARCRLATALAMAEPLRRLLAAYLPLPFALSFSPLGGSHSAARPRHVTYRVPLHLVFRSKYKPPRRPDRQ